MPDTARPNSADAQLRQLVERIERLEEDKAAIAGDIREVYAEAKAHGFDTKILRKVIGLRRKDRAEREEEDAVTTLYMQALGMLPLWEAADTAAPDTPATDPAEA
ncbi:DUF2312 domain-containing protein [Kaustia mangrovi]|uniref:DUF2312 domain-containing protein n=1 Tax=Kaustia mangrovi TaxID=2593653 RepID=A0A7S8C7Z0_9HYPH|nr:DUF2312 domain-containing protein [Kaustia mangrovi]QPC45037.1 DUF2312 domain-containing protein [Kaustia mangrovi]